MGERAKSIGLIALLVLTAVIALIAYVGQEGESPATLSVSAVAGRAVLVPYAQKLPKRVNFTGGVSASHVTQPRKLPQEIEIVASEFRIVGGKSSPGSASGWFVLWIPRRATGQVEFEIWVTAQARSRDSGEPRRIKTPSLQVTVDIDEYVADPPPLAFSGTWSGTGRHESLTLAFHGNGYRVGVTGGVGPCPSGTHRIYPGGAYDWFLGDGAPKVPSGIKLRLEAHDGELTLWHLNPRRKRPFAVLRR